MTRTRLRFAVLGCLLTLLGLVVVLPTPARGDDDGHELTVRCDKGKTLGAALAKHDDAVTLKIVGICDEHIAINRNDVSLVAGAPGAGIHGPDPTRNTLQVTGDRFLLDGLTVTGGRNAIVVSGGTRAAIQNCTVLASGNGIVGGIGIVFFHGTTGTIDNCTSNGNPADGLMLDGAVVSITNSSFSSNHRAGILVFGGSSARIGLSNAFTSAGNTINSNASNGVHVTIGSTAIVIGNTISGNGTDPAGPLGRFGIAAAIQSRIDLAAGNTITNNFGAGVFVGSGSLAAIGDPGFGLGTANLIRGNSTAAPSQGVNVTANATLVMRGATIDANNGAGIALSARSTMSAVSNVITGNSGNGIQLSQGSAAIFQPIAPFSNVSGNTGTDVICLDGESSVTGPLAPGATINCTGF
jgi:Right handed beta helix region